MALFERLRTPFAEDAPRGDGVSPNESRSVGEMLRQRREALGLDLSQIAGVLRIKPAYLEALEDGRLDRLPGPVYAAGFMRAYGEHIGLDGAEMMRRFRTEAAGLDVKPDLSFPMPLGERGVPGGTMLLVAFILAICGYGTWYYLSTSDRSRPERVTEVPVALLPPEPVQPIVHADAPTRAEPSGETLSPAPTAAMMPETATETAAQTLPATMTPPSLQPAPNPGEPGVATTLVMPASAAPAASAPPSNPASAPDQPRGEQRADGTADPPARIVLRAVADSWIQVRDADRSVLFTRLMKTGESYSVPERPGVSMRIGNAGGLEITVDGKTAPALGPAGAVRRDVALDPEKLMAGTAVRE